MKRLVISAILVLITSLLNAQVKTLNPRVGSSNTHAEILFVVVGENGTLVGFNFYSMYIRGVEWVSFSSSTTLNYTDPHTMQRVSVSATEIRRGEKALPSNFNQKYRVTDFGTLPAQPVFWITFGKIPPGVSSISVSENVFMGFQWNDIEITPWTINVCPSLEVDTEEEIIGMISKIRCLQPE